MYERRQIDHAAAHDAHVDLHGTAKNISINTTNLNEPRFLQCDKRRNFCPGGIAVNLDSVDTR